MDAFCICGVGGGGGGGGGGGKAGGGRGRVGKGKEEGRRRAEGRKRGGREESGKQTFHFLKNALDGARAAGAGHGDLEFVVVGCGGHDFSFFFNLIMDVDGWIVRCDV